MRRTYQWGWQLDPAVQALPSQALTPEEYDKRWYVIQYLDPSVDKANCGWHGIAYAVCEENGENRREYVLMFADKNDTPNAARWIDVTGESKGSIAEAVWSLVFS